MKLCLQLSNDGVHGVELSIQIHTYTIIIVRIKPTRKHNTKGVEARETRNGQWSPKEKLRSILREILRYETDQLSRSEDIPLGFAETHRQI